MGVKEHDSKNNNSENRFMSLKLRGVYLLALGIAAGAVFTVFAIIELSSKDSISQAVEISDMAGLSIGRYAGKPTNDLRPLQNVDLSSVAVSSPRIQEFISQVDISYNPESSYTPSAEFVITRAEALALLQAIPFTYHDSDTIANRDVYSTDIEINGKYYGVVVIIPKAVS